MNTKKISEKKNQPILNILLGALICLFCLSLFKNMSYPLIWNDESETVMMASHVLEYGYPKVHDDKNTVFMMPVNHFDSVKNFRVGYKKEYDAFIGNTWGMYYVAALGVYSASQTNDIYEKTFRLRFPFALSALLGLIFFCLAFKRFFPEIISFKYFSILFTTLCLLSVSLIYHMREARYYSLVIFAIALFFYTYINFFFFKKYSKKKYILFLLLILLLNYHINFITYVIVCGFIVFHEAAYFTYNCFFLKNSQRTNKYKEEFLRIMPTGIAVGISAVLVFPFISFYDTINISQHVSNDYNFSYETYKRNLTFIYEYFIQQDFLVLSFIVSSACVFLVWMTYSFKKSWKQISKTNPSIINKLRLAFFLILFAIVYTLLIARSPYIFARHFIVLQPILSLIIILNLFICYDLIKTRFPKQYISYSIGFSIVIFFIFSGKVMKKIPFIKEHIYQCTHQFKGVLDYQIPYILENFKNPENLTIATNYEEFALMYYLKSKVVLGYIMNEMEEAAKLEPDIIIFRKGLGTNPKIFNDYLTKRKYNRVAFPIYDYPVNNIPEIEFMIPHLFRTKFAKQENEKADLLIKEN